MQPLKVIVAMEMEARHLEAIAAVHPGIQVSYTTSGVFGPEHAYRWGPVTLPASALPPIDDDPQTALREADVMLTMMFPPDIAVRAPRLKWIQVTMAGVEWLQRNPALDSDITFTVGGDVGTVSIVEWVIGVMVMFTKQIHLAQRDRQERRWRTYSTGELSAKTIGIVGLGRIGSHLARLAKAMGMRVVATRRSLGTGPAPAHVDQLYAREQLHDLLGASDFVAICLPLTPETSKLIGEAELRAMRPSAYLLNVSRGKTVDEAMLVRALKEGWIAGAGLDVFEKEPLPPDSELWDLPNVIMTPHISGATELYYERAIGLFCENLRRYIAGEKLLHVMDRSKGY